ncbi:uncharacterized protein [Rutidosis leptorrhynchoides]|uniref:uncharacterized protein n=1 Tax=Rutidosis leptorrhynchoides TaxID=125765 RepID=UPI003A994255
MLKQKARYKWALEGDENSKFFHSCIRKRQHKNNIHGVNVNGVWSTDPAVIKNEAHKHFANLFSGNKNDGLQLENGDGPRIEKVLADKLEEEFSECETLEAIKSCGKNKAPGPDGFNLLFYIKFWDIIKVDLMKAITWFWNSGSISNGCNASFITLIPKGSFPFTYLGLPIGANLKCYKNWMPVFDKFKNRLADWKCPSGCLKNLEGIRRDFFGGGSNEQRKMAWVNWNQILLPYDAGGLNISSMKNKNLALLTKWWWKFLTNKEALWVKVIKSIYGYNDGLDCILPSPSISKGLTDTTWTNIINVKHTLTKLGCDITNMFVKRIGAGSETFFWHDKWIGDTVLKKAFPRLFRLDSNKMAMVSDRMLWIESEE